jgi:hypothetical protein
LFGVSVGSLAGCGVETVAGDILISSTVDTLSSVGQASRCSITCEAVSLSIAESYHICCSFATFLMIYAALNEG